MNELQKALARQQELVTLARNEGRDLTAEEQAEFDRCQAVIDAGNEGGEAGGQPAGGERGAENGGQGAPAGTNQPSVADTQRAIQAERQRTADIMALCRQTGMDAEEYIRSGATMDTVRAAAVDFLIQHNGPVGARMSDNSREQDNFRQAAVDGLLMRSGMEVERPSENAEQMRGLSLRDLAIECMAREGLGTTASLLRMSKDDLWNMACRQFFNPTAAFPAILDNTIRKAIVQRYQAVPTTFQVWTTKGSVTDFKPTKDHEYLAGGAGEFLRVGEGGELKHDTPQTELLPQRQVATYGRQFSMTREAFINDDVGFITQVPGMYAASAKRTINKQVYSILFNNPTIFDGVALFHANHNNLITTGAAPSIETLQAIMIKLLNQKDPLRGQHYGAAPVHHRARGLRVPYVADPGNRADRRGRDRQPHRKRPVSVPEPPAGDRGGHPERPGRFQRGALVRRGRSHLCPFHPGGLPERPGNPDHSPHGGGRPTGLCVGHLAGLGYHRRGLPWYCQEPRNHHHAVRQ